MQQTQLAIGSLDAWLASLTLGRTSSHGSLSLVPVYQRARAGSLDYLLLDRAIDEGHALVRELEQETVPVLRIENRGVRPILLLDCEQVVGGRQHRIVNRSQLVPAATTMDLLVTCVEQNRWEETSRDFSVGEAAYPSLRQQKTRHVQEALARDGRAMADQRAIWAEISALHRRIGGDSRTGAMKDAYDQQREQLDSVCGALPCPSDNPVGVIALIGGRSRCADLFDRPETSRAAWARLVRSYALEAAGVPARSVSRGTASRLMSRARMARRIAYRAEGLGVDVRLNGNGIVGAALVEAGVPVHISMFRQPQA
ncbi:MAG: hypothetical protein IT305_25300 [Chloroflexi bacterium]|nr:hypothetical protein [Chloroflexota bacterium]